MAQVRIAGLERKKTGSEIPMEDIVAEFEDSSASSSDSDY
jgi:hypothetical protein